VNKGPAGLGAGRFSFDVCYYERKGRREKGEGRKCPAGLGAGRFHLDVCLLVWKRLIMPGNMLIVQSGGSFLPSPFSLLPCDLCLLVWKRLIMPGNMLIVQSGGGFLPALCSLFPCMLIAYLEYLGGGGVLIKIDFTLSSAKT
jgi:hypothetical protein